MVFFFIMRMCQSATICILRMYSDCNSECNPIVLRLYSECAFFSIVSNCCLVLVSHKGLCAQGFAQVFPDNVLGSWCACICGAGKGQGRQPEERRRIHDHEAPKAASIPTPHTQTTFTLALLWAMLCSHGYPRRQSPAFCMKFSALVHRYSG